MAGIDRVRLDSHQFGRSRVRCFLGGVASVLAVTLLCNSLVLAADVPHRTAADPVQLKLVLSKRGVGKGIRVMELDGTAVTGNLAGIRDDDFDVRAKGAQVVTIKYAQVASVENHGLSKGTKIGIGVVVGLVVAAGVIAIVVVHSINNLSNLKIAL